MRRGAEITFFCDFFSNLTGDTTCFVPDRYRFVAESVEVGDDEFLVAFLLLLFHETAKLHGSSAQAQWWLVERLFDSFIRTIAQSFSCFAARSQLQAQVIALKRKQKF
jgi:hypothetical protein